MEHSAQQFDFATGGKFSKQHTYINVVYVLNYPYRYLVRLAAYVGIPPNTITSWSLAAGALAAWLVMREQFVLALLFIYLTDLLDATDGALARYTNTHTRVGRFLDATGDWAGITLIFLALGTVTVREQPPVLVLCTMLFAWLIIFLQASYYNYFLIRYSESLNEPYINSTTDERVTAEERKKWSVLRLTKTAYMLTLGWQDVLIGWFDRLSSRSLNNTQLDRLYQHKLLLCLNSFFLFRFPLLLIGIVTVIWGPWHALVLYCYSFSIAFVWLLIIRQLIIKNAHIFLTARV